MNGDTYSSRDAGRHGSSRDYPPPRRDRDDRRDRGGGDRTDRSDRAPVGDRSDRATVRRRSRSPDYRSSGAAGRSRREEGDVDTYSSSRTHRDREREDRYSGRDRRGPERGAERAPDRGAERGAERGADRPERGPDRDRERERDWDRDRGAGRSRRDHDDGGRRRDRDVVDDRRAPRGGMDREFERERERRRSASPPPKKREPTPDLTDVVPILERKRRLTQWDIKPPGYDNVTAEQAKLSGMFPLPGAPRQQTMDPTKLQALMTQPSANSTTSSLLKPTNARQSKRLIVKNLPPSATEESVLNFFNLQLNGLNVIESTDPCALCQIAPDHSFAMLEFRNSGDATVALALDGIMMEADDSGANANTAGGMPEGLNIRRPKDYIVPAIVDDPNYDPDSPTPSSVVLDTPNKISLANIPIIFNEDQVLELAIAFGKVKSFVLVKDNGTDESRGIAFLEYVDPSATDVAIEALNGMPLGTDLRLKAKKASIGITQVAGEINVNAMSMLAGTTSIDPDVSRVLQLLNMVTPDELMDNDDYEEIRDDIQEECEKFGKILSLKIPRPTGGSRQSAGVGRIFIKYETPDSATKALRALAGRKFADRTVVATYFPEENFDVSAW